MTLTAEPTTTRTSTPKLSDIARHVVIPEGIVKTSWPAVVKKCAELDVEFDDWEHGVGRIALGKRADGKWAATIGGIILSIPRQTGKTFLVAMILIALALIFPGLTILWTAHHGRTVTKTFATMKELTARPRIAKYLLPPRDSSGEYEVRFRNGTVIMFGARAQGFGRGFDKVDIIVFDEAQILTAKTVDDMVPSANQSTWAPSALLFFLGTPPKPTDPGEEFSRRRDAALAQKTEGSAQAVGGNAVFVEFSADDGADPLDDAQRRKANPSYPKRTPVEAMLRMLEQLGPDSFAREAYGIWPKHGAGEKPTIGAGLWSDRGTPQPAPEGSVTYGIRFSPDGARVAISFGIKSGDGVHVELVDVGSTGAGITLLADWCAERKDRADLFVVDGKSHRDLFVKALADRGVKDDKILAPTVDQVISAHSGFLDAVQTGALEHFDDDGQAVLDDSVSHAKQRPIGKTGGWGWEAINDGDVTPLESVTLAHYGVVSPKKRRSGRAVFR